MNLAVASTDTLRAEPDLLYRKIVAEDYMEHLALAEQVVKVMDTVPRVGRILDLGCGEAPLVTRLSRHREIDEYFGVDRNPEALDRAAEQLEGIASGVHLFEEQMLDFLWGTSFDFDLILIGYALNSLAIDEKRALLRLARTRLSADGVLLVYDVFRNPGESRQQCLDGYARIMEEDWIALPESELQAIKTHINRCWFPEDVDTFCGLAARAGLRPDPDPIWSGQNPYHKLICARPC